MQWPRWSLFPSPCAGSTSSTLWYNYVFSSSIEEPTPGDGRLLFCRDVPYISWYGNDRIVVIWGERSYRSIPYRVVARSLCASSTVYDLNLATVIRANIWCGFGGPKTINDVEGACWSKQQSSDVLESIRGYTGMDVEGVEGGVRTIEPIAGWTRHVGLWINLSLLQ